jgi:ferredoxin-nitrite reductase
LLQRLALMNKVEAWKAEKHGFDVWPDLERHAEGGTPMAEIPEADLERMKWYGIFYRKRVEDGRYMIRIRIPGCEFTANQGRAVAAIARTGYSIIDVTTRGNLQIQGLAVSDLPEVIAQLDAVGLTSKQTGHDNVRNVMTHPWAGLDPAEILDVRPLCWRLTEVFLDDRLLSNLPRKFNVAVDGRPAPALHCYTQDTSFVAARRNDGSVAFHWLLAGTQGQNPHLAWKIPVWVTEDQAPDVLRHSLHVFREEGSRERRDKARLRYLIERIGEREFLAQVEARLGYRLEPCALEIKEIDEQEDFLGWFSQKQPGLWALGVSVPLGRLTHEQLDGLAEIAERCGDGTLRTAYDQGVVIPNVAANRRTMAVRGLNRLGLEHEADSVTRNIIACTGRQFCNIAVAETKGHAFSLIDTLRAKGVKLNGIKINMSGCPSACAQTHTGDIGLKGVRVRRGSETRDAFDVLVGGGVHKQVELGRLYRKGVDLDQLPELIAELVRTYDELHSTGQTFSQFWRERVPDDHDTSALGADDYRPDVWRCEVCRHEHTGDDPPVFCPKCASLRRNFVRLGQDERAAEPDPAGLRPGTVAAAARPDGYRDVAAFADLERDGRRAIKIGAHELALFLIGSEVRCLDGLCPHEGGPMAQGDVADCVVNCPWHGWAFNCTTGQSADGNGCTLGAYPVKVENGRILVAETSLTTHSQPASGKADDSGVELRVLEVIQETADVKTVKLDNSSRLLGLHKAGQHVKVCANGPAGSTWRSFTLSSPPSRPDVVELTVKRNPTGVVSAFVHGLSAGDQLMIKGPYGDFVYDHERHTEPLVLASAGSGITPAMCVLRMMNDFQIDRPVTLLYGCRTRDDVIFARELDRLRLRLAGFRLVITLSRPDPAWNGSVGHVSPSLLARHVPQPERARFYLCGPGNFTETLSSWLLARDVPRERIQSERFGKSNRAAAPAGASSWDARAGSEILPVVV